MNSFRDIIDSWPALEPRTSRQVFADDCGVSKGTAQQWYNRDSIPPTYWLTIVDAAKGRAVPGIDLELLARIVAGKEAA